MRTKVLKLGAYGMFANVNEVICQLKMAEMNGYNFIIDWTKSLYKDDSMQGSPWNYFFEDCFEDVDINANDKLPFIGNSDNKNINIMRPRVYKNVKSPMLLPEDRNEPHRMINQYLKLKPNIENIIEDYEREYFDAYIIGLHLRGPGRLDGGTKELKVRHKLKNGIPFDLYFEHVDHQLSLHPSAKVFVCSDSQMVIDECKYKYNNIITYNSIRSSFGEMHHDQNYGRHKKYSRYKLGEDVIVEAYLLSKVDFLIHGNSNVSNFVLCANPTLGSKYVYEEDAHTRLSLRLLNFLPMRSIRRMKRQTAKGARKATRGARRLLSSLRS